MNHLTLTGRMVTDIEYGEGNRPHRFRMAFDRKKGDEYVSAFLSVDAFLDAASLEESGLGKGSLVIVSGELDFFKAKNDDQVLTIIARDVGSAVKYRAKGDSGGNGRSNGRSNGSRASSRTDGTRSQRDEDEAF